MQLNNSIYDQNYVLEALDSIAWDLSDECLANAIEIQAQQIAKVDVIDNFDIQL